MRQHLALGIVVALCVSGCGLIEPIFVWTRKEPAAGRHSPTTFIERVRVDVSARTVTIAEEVHDDEGDLGQTVTTFQGCNVLDAKNWVCNDAIGKTQYRMVRGELSETYWSEEREFRRRYRIAF